MSNPFGNHGGNPFLNPGSADLPSPMSDAYSFTDPTTDLKFEKLIVTVTEPKEKKESTSDKDEKKEVDKKDEKKEEKKEEGSIYQYRVPLMVLRAAKEVRHESSEFELEGLKWKMLVFPFGNGNDQNVNVSMYIALCENNYGGIFCKFRFTVVHPTDQTKNIARDSHHVFTTTSDRGFGDLIKISELPNYVHQDNDLVINIWVNKSASESSSFYPFYQMHDSKAETGFVGLKNQGATCYMNSMLQALYTLPKFRQVVYSIPTEQVTPKTKIAAALQRVFYELQTSKDAVSTKLLTKSFGWESMEAFMQHDVQEFSRVLLDDLDTNTKKTAMEGVVAALFEGKMQAYITCIHVNYSSTREETFWDLALNVKGLATLQDSFKQYVEEEMLEGDNKYRAEGHGLQDAKKGSRFLHFPPVLQLQLKRFEYDPYRDTMVKINDRFEFPTELNLEPFLPDDKKNEKDPAIYYVHSVLVHSGGVHGGHYFAYIRPFMSNVPYQESPWFKFDDENVYKVADEEALQGNFGGSEARKNNIYAKSSTSAYMLVYIRKSVADAIAPNTVAQTTPAQLEEVKEEDKPEAETVAADPKDDKDDDKKEEKKEEKKEPKLEQYNVPIPANLSARFQAEDSENAAKNDQQKKAYLYLNVRVVSETKLLEGAQDENSVLGCGSELTKEVASAATHQHIRFDEPSEEIKILKKDPLSNLLPEIEKKLQIPVDQQDIWLYSTRHNKPRRPSKRVMTRLDMPIETALESYHYYTGASVYLRSKTSPVASAPLPPEMTPDGEETTLICIKLFDAFTQSFVFLGSQIFKSEETVENVKNYTRAIAEQYFQKKKYNLASSQWLCYLEVNGEDGETLDLQSSEHLTLAGNRCANGDILIIQPVYEPEKLIQLQGQHDQKYKHFLSLLPKKGGETMNLDPSFIVPKSTFCGDAALYLSFLASRITVEFRAVGFQPVAKNAKPSTTNHVFTLELNKELTYHQLVDTVHSVLGVPNDCLQFFNHSILNEHVPNTIAIHRSSYVSLERLTVADMLNRSMENILYFEVMEFSHTQLQENFVVNVSYANQQLKELSFRVLVPKLGTIKDLDTNIRTKVQALDPSADVFNKKLRLFSVDFAKRIHQFHEQDTVSAFKDVSYGLELSVEEIPDDQLNLSSEDETVQFIHRYIPTSKVYCKTIASPFSFIVKKDETLESFKQRVIARLNLNEQQAAKLSVALLETSTMYSPLDDDKVKPFDAVSEATVALPPVGLCVFDASHKLSQQKSASYRSWYNASIKFKTDDSKGSGSS